MWPRDDRFWEHGFCFSVDEVPVLPRWDWGPEEVNYWSHWQDANRPLRPFDRAQFCGEASRLQPTRLFAAPSEAAATYMAAAGAKHTGLGSDDQLSYLLDTAATRGGKVGVGRPVCWIYPRSHCQETSSRQAHPDPELGAWIRRCTCLVAVVVFKCSSCSGNMVEPRACVQIFRPVLQFGFNSMYAAKLLGLLSVRPIVSPAPILGRAPP